MTDPTALEVGRERVDSQALPAHRLAMAKASYTTRHVARWIDADPAGFALLAARGLQPSSGDVVLARVEEIGQHTRIELPDSRRARLFPGDEVIVAFGNRYAPDQFEAEVPDDLGPAHLVAAGGLAGRMLSRHASIKDPTVIQPLGLLCRDGEVVNLSRCAPARVRAGPAPATVGRPPVVAVVGTSMNSGKSSTAAAVIRGLSAAGLDVAAGKVTGTGAGGDPRLFGDAGASNVLDFTDFGYASTYKLGDVVVRALLADLTATLSVQCPEIIVLEIADGIFQQETARLLADPMFARMVDTVVFSAADAAGAYAGTRLLGDRGIDVAAVSGVLTSAPLAAREAATVVSVPVVSTDDLANPLTAVGVFSAHLPDLVWERDEA